MLYRLWPFIATCMLSFVFLIGHAQAQSQTVSEDEVAIQKVITDQIDAFQSKDYDRAFSHAAPTIKQIFKTKERFIGMVKGGYEPLYNPESYAFSRSIEQGGSLYQEVLVTDQSGKQWQAVYTLKQQPDGTWKITGVKMEPTQGAST